MSELYRAAGVDIAAGDEASRIAYRHARATFDTRRGKLGLPIDIEGGFSGLIDMGAFCLTFNSDGVGTKALVAHDMRRYDTLGYDLVAMVADDACCLGAEPTSMVNTLDMEKVDTAVVESLMSGLEAAARVAGCAVVGGEIAEMPDGIRGISWSAGLIGTVPRDKVIDGRNVQADDVLVGIHTENFRANGFTLLRRILRDHYGPEWVSVSYDNRQTWGEIALEPSLIFTPLAMKLTAEPQAAIHAIAHITGGGLRHNVGRVIPRGFRAVWDSLPAIPHAMKRLMDIGKVPWEEAERVWNLGVGMVFVTPEPDKCIGIAHGMGFTATRIGRVVED